MRLGKIKTHWAILVFLLISARLALATEIQGTAALVVVTGIGGEPRFDERFHAWAATLLDAAAERGVPEDALHYLAGDPERDPARVRGRASKANVLAALEEIATSLEGGGASQGAVVLVLIGHGSHRDGATKINLPGPDLTATELAAALDAFGERPLVVANLSSASGASLETLKAPERVVIAATRSAAERNATIFARFFAAAFVGKEADVDHDERVSLREAFDAAQREVERLYARDQKILTEHAVLADVGGLAERVFLGAGVSDEPPSDPAAAALRTRITELEAAVAELRESKSSLEREDYEARLEELLVELALAHREAREREAVIPERSR